MRPPHIQRRQGELSFASEINKIYLFIVQGEVQGNCRTVDSTGAQWCYVDTSYSSCADLVPSLRLLLLLLLYFSFNNNQIDKHSLVIYFISGSPTTPGHMRPVPLRPLALPSAL